MKPVRGHRGRRIDSAGLAFLRESSRLTSRWPLEGTRRRVERSRGRRWCAAAGGPRVCGRSAERNPSRSRTWRYLGNLRRPGGAFSSRHPQELVLKLDDPIEDSLSFATIVRQALQCGGHFSFKPGVTQNVICVSTTQSIFKSTWSRRQRRISLSRPGANPIGSTMRIGRTRIARCSEWRKTRCQT